MNSKSSSPGSHGIAGVEEPVSGAKHSKHCGGHIQGPFPQQYNRYPVQTSLARKLKTQKDVTVATFKRT